MTSPAFIASLSWSGGGWIWAALIAAVVLVPLAWLASRPAGHRSGAIALGLGLRTLGLGLLLLCLLEPQWVASRAKRGANAIALLADNSEGMNVVEVGAAASRGAQMKTALVDGRADWLARMSDEFQVRPYVFDRSLRRVQDFGSLDFRGDRTSLAAALGAVRERFAGQPLAGVLLFTDGNATDIAASALPDLAGLPPIYPVIVGEAGATRDVMIQRADVRQTAFDDGPVSLRARVSGHRAEDSSVDVRIRAINTASETQGDAPPPVTLRLSRGSNAQEANFSWRPPGTGIQFFEVSADSGTLGKSEATLLNNRRRLLVDRGRPAYRILYVSGRPNWDYKFLNRALGEDPQLQMVGLIRVARREPKFEFKGRAGEAANPLFRGFDRDVDETVRYDQPVLVRVSARDENELRGGFPTTAGELFAYDAVVIDDLEAGFFTNDQLELLRRFTAERGGGLLMLGGADALESGGYARSPLAAALPLHLDRPAETVPSGELSWALTREGWVEPWVRVRPAEAQERERLERMPAFQVANALSSIKPGATTLATVEDQQRHVFPALVAQRYGAGRVACITLGDVWRWALRGDEEQMDLARFWRQLARWMVTDTPAQVTLRVEPVAEAAGRKLRVIVRDAAFRPLDTATVRVTVRRVDAPAATNGQPSGFSSVTLPAEPVANAPGEFAATIGAQDAGCYLADVEAMETGGKLVGRAQAGWVNDPLAEEFASLEPNRSLMEEIARRTGGEVLTFSQLAALAERLPRQAAPIMEARSWPLWHQSWVFLIVLACFLAEWALRRWKGLP
jgi:uncharacterized membrane protein